MPMTTAPHFDDLEVGQVEAGAPALMLSSGLAAAHQAILGDRLRLALDGDLCARVTLSPVQLAHPGLVCDVAIGQSTLLTQRVIGNLFYRGLVLRRAPVIGDTLHTTTEVVALRQSSRKPGRPASGLAALRVRASDQAGRAVLDFHRCAMLPLADPEGETGWADEIDAVVAEPPAGSFAAALEGWDCAAYRDVVPGPHFADLAAGQRWHVQGCDVVSSAPELARLTLNVAFAHHDAAATGRGRRLVYGGHTIGIAAAQLTRAIPSLLTILAWHSCDHLGPVFEGDTLRSEVELERIEPLEQGGGLAHLRVLTRALGGSEVRAREVLDWRLVGAMA
jgi:acyl dehydratase